MYSQEKVKEIVARQQLYFSTGATREVQNRKNALDKLEKSILAHEQDLYDAFYIDLGKGKSETYMAEISMILSELRAIRRNIGKWSKPRKVRGTLSTFPAKSRIYMEPYGVVLVLAPWNYPFLLAMSPVVGALAAGNCAVLKCSKSSPHCAKVIQTIIEEALPQELCCCVDAEVEYDSVLNQTYNYIFFTGSPRVGKQIMAKASEQLIPVSLELGGKSPCFVTDSADIKMAAHRIVWGKLLNAGQTCISVDYILVDAKVKDKLIEAIKADIQLNYPDAAHNPEYPRIISKHHYDRLCKLIEAEREAGPVWGGEGDEKERRLAPAIIIDAAYDHEIMKEEIFGPIIPIISYENLDEMVEEVNARPHPLACYIFTEDKKLAEDLLKRIPFGGGCINDAIMHIANHHMPFGGVGNSGMGGYHGYYSFETFSHKKSIVKNPTFIDMPIRYAPFNEKKWKMVKKIL